LKATETPQGRPASEQFLQHLLSDFRFIRDQYILDHENVVDEEVHKCLEALFHECDRIYDHPELVPNEERHRLFLGSVYNYYVQIERAIKLWEDWDIFSQRIYNSRQEDIVRKRQARYDSTIPAWNNFLDAGAPAMLDIVNSSSHPNARVIPSAGVQILDKWMRDYRAAEDSVQQDDKLGRMKYSQSFSSFSRSDTTTILEPRTIHQNQSDVSVIPVRWDQSPFNRSVPSIINPYEPLSPEVASLSLSK
jgi:hypothetical protein